MAARNPGPYLNPAPIGFPAYHTKIRKDWLARSAFAASEISDRVTKNMFEALGIRGSIPVNKQTGVLRIRMRCIQSGYGRGTFRYTRLSKMAMHQINREGWLAKYGLRAQDIR